MPENSADPAVQPGQITGNVIRAERACKSEDNGACYESGETFYNIKEKHGNPGLFPKNTADIRSAGCSAVMLAYVGLREYFPEYVSELQATKPVANQ